MLHIVKWFRFCQLYRATMLTEIVWYKRLWVILIEYICPNVWRINFATDFIFWKRYEHFKKLSVPYATHFLVAYGTHIFLNALIFFRKWHQWQSSFTKHKGKCTLSISPIIFYIKQFLSAWWPFEVGKIWTILRYATFFLLAINSRFANTQANVFDCKHGVLNEVNLH